MYKRNYYLQLIDQDLHTVDTVQDINPEQIKYMKIYNSLAITTIFTVMFIIIVLLSGTLIYQHMLYSKNVNNLTSEYTIMNDQLHEKIQTDIIYKETGEAFINNDIPFPTDSLIKVYDYIKELKAWYPEVIFAQLLLESNNGKSFLAKNYNNYFGMKKAKTRPSLQLPDTYNGYAIKLNWQHSIIDRILWDRYMFKNNKPNKTDYIKSLSIYAEDTDYISKLKQVLKKYNMEL